MDDPLQVLGRIVKSPSWGDLKDFLEQEQRTAVASMVRATDAEGIYESRGRYRLIQELLRMEDTVREAR